MKKKLALLLAALLLFGSAACGKTETADDTQQEIQTEFNLPKCGLSYTIPDEWVEMENTNLIPASYVKVNGDIYAKIQYNYAPDENMEPLNDAESTIAVEELMTPIVEMLVVRTENLETDEVKNVQIHGIYEAEQTMVHGDRDKISRVLQNLLGNAAKFSPQNGIIEVETTLDKKKVLVSVKDQGPGISEEDQKYVFDRFFKTDTTRNMDKTGSGIGLAIVREFLQAHGETITVKSEKGKGAAFVFSLKLAKKEN